MSKLIKRVGFNIAVKQKLQMKVAFLLFKTMYFSLIFVHVFYAKNGYQRTQTITKHPVYLEIFKELRACDQHQTQQTSSLILRGKLPSCVFCVPCEGVNLNIISTLLYFLSLDITHVLVPHILLPVPLETLNSSSQLQLQNSKF